MQTNTQLKNRFKDGLNQTKRLAESPSGSTQEEPQKQPVCPECIDGSGWITLYDGQREYKIGAYQSAMECKACAQRRLVEKRIELQCLSGLSPREAQIRFSDIDTQDRPDTQKMLLAFEKFVQEGATGMLTVHGTNGNGKSAALIATVNECLDLGYPALYIVARDLLNWIQDAFNQDSTTNDGSALDRLNRLKEIRVLAIDELQAVKMSDWRIEQLENIIDHRWRFGAFDNHLGTLFAMNEHPDRLESGRIRSRLMYGSQVENTIIENNDADMRPYLR